MLVILIGPDKSGKSTIARELNEEFGWSVYKGLPVPPDKLFAQIKNVLHQLEREGNLICDRFHYPDDLMYAPIVDGHESWLEDKRDDLEWALNKYRTLLVYVYADENMIDRRYTSAVEDKHKYYMPIEKIPKLIEAYEEFVKVTKLPVLRVDTSYALKAATLDIVKQHIIGFKMGVESESR